MPLVSSNNVDYAKAAKQMQMLQVEREAFNKDQKEWLKGRSIQQAEQDAQKALASAKIEAQKILDAAREKEKEAEQVKTQSEAMKAKIEGQEAKAARAEKDALAIEAKAKEELEQLEVLQRQAMIQIDKAEKRQAQFDEKIKKIESSLQKILDEAY